jgi:putative membrane protein
MCLKENQMHLDYHNNRKASTSKQDWLIPRLLLVLYGIVSLFPVFAIAAVAGLYEIFEWQYAISADASAGIAVLGSQGDIWDAQKDILADTLGAILVMTLFFYQHRVELATLRRRIH